MTADVRHQNKLTKCFDDIMKAAAEMLVQQQIKSIQLSSNIAPGFTQSQHKLLGEKVHTFHSVLDDIDLTLTTAKSCVDKFATEATERRQKLLEEQRQQQKLKEEQEERERRLVEAQRVPEPAPPSSADFTESTPGAFLNEISKTEIAGSKPNSKASNASKSDADSGKKSGNSNSNYGTDFNDLNDLDLSMFGGMEQNDLGLADFGEEQMRTNIEKTAANENAYTTSMGPSNNDDPSQALNNDNNAANPDSYLTLNDFNDLGLDWNASEGQNGLDEFSI
ncbi:LANO_0C03378g1_1 [Lachancea nothofagi CBS 11611]|uniref:LANO_0C03378g1_1 n=1 Tax=Lachancea nothofagi CBS 11611 TaxID=1266666 RepID=A0A1G4J5N9_9SACH|nr:LANO_0C03378g1_1 [Lachancea nothofagi CBS 11611]